MNARKHFEFVCDGPTLAQPGVRKYGLMWFNLRSLLDLCTVKQSVKYELPGLIWASTVASQNLEKTRFLQLTLRLGSPYPTSARWSFDLLAVNDTGQHGLPVVRLTARRGAPI